MGQIRRICLAGVIATLGTLVLGAIGARAASVVAYDELDDAPILDVLGDDKKNNVTVSADKTFPSALLITDATGILEPVPLGCERLSPTSVRCLNFNIAAVRVRLEGGDDRFEAPPPPIPASIELHVHGGKDDDTIRGRDASGRDELFGDDGVDKLFGLDGADLLDGGIGDDDLDGGLGSDNLKGGEGEDSLNGGDGFFEDKLDGGGGNDILNGLKEDDTLFGGKGNDKLFGGPGNDRGIGGPGRDLFSGGKGRDRGKAEREKGVEV